MVSKIFFYTRKWTNPPNRLVKCTTTQRRLKPVAISPVKGNPVYLKNTCPDALMLIKMENKEWRL